MAQYGVTVMYDTVHLSGVSGGGHYDAGDTVYLNVFVKPGCTFTRWTGDFTGSSNPLMFTMPEADVSVYAEGDGTPYDYTITYHDNGGTGSPSPTYKYAGQPVNLSLVTPTYVNHQFLGWGLSASATTASYQAGDVYTADADADLYAVWDESAVGITYHSNEGSSLVVYDAKIAGTPLTIRTVESTSWSKSYTVTFNANGGAVTPPTKEVDCIFNGWNTASDGTGTYYEPGDSYATESSLDLYAIWLSNTIGVLPTPTRTHCQFVGWTTTLNGSTIIDHNYVVSADTTVYAKWLYNVILRANGGKIVDSSGQDPVEVEEVVIGKAVGDTVSFAPYTAYKIDIAQSSQVLEGLVLSDPYDSSSESGQCLASVGNNIFVFSSASDDTKIQKVNTSARSVSTLVSPSGMVGVDKSSGCAAVGTDIYLLGSKVDTTQLDWSSYNVIQKYSTTTGTIQTLADTLAKMVHKAACVTSGTDIYMIGGEYMAQTTTEDTIASSISKTLRSEPPEPFDQDGYSTGGGPLLVDSIVLDLSGYDLTDYDRLEIEWKTLSYRNSSSVIPQHKLEYWSSLDSTPVVLFNEIIPLGDYPYEYTGTISIDLTGVTSMSSFTMQGSVVNNSNFIFYWSQLIMSIESAKLIGHTSTQEIKAYKGIQKYDTTQGTVTNISASLPYNVTSGNNAAVLIGTDIYIVADNLTVYKLDTTDDSLTTVKATGVVPDIEVTCGAIGDDVYIFTADGVYRFDTQRNTMSSASVDLTYDPTGAGCAVIFDYAYLIGTANDTASDHHDKYIEIYQAFLNPTSAKIWVGWSEDPAATVPTYTQQSTYSTDAPIVLYAVYVDNAYTVTFYLDSSFTTVLQTYTNVLPGTSLTPPPTPTKPGYAFQGWSTNAYLNVTQDLNVFGMWGMSYVWIYASGQGWIPYEPQE